MSEKFCDDDLNKLSIVSYRGKIERIKVKDSSIYTSSNFDQLDYKPLTIGARSDFEERGFFFLVIGVGLFILSYLLFGGVRISFWRRRERI